MNNQKLSFEQMKEMVEIFVRHKLNSLKVGDLELAKSHYEADSTSSDNKTSFQEDPLFYSAPQLPPEMQALMESMQARK